MVNPQKFYVKEISKKTKYRANWLPDKPMNAGDIGKIEDGIFTLYTTLEQQGFQVRIKELSFDTDYNFTSADSVRIDFNGQDQGMMAAGSPKKCKVEFLNSEGLIFQISDSKRLVLDNLGELENQILEKYKKGVWDLGWVLVTEVVRPQSATILINTGDSNDLEFEITKETEADVRTLTLADSRLGLRLVKEAKTNTLVYIARGDLTPLYVIKGISDPLFGKTKFRGAKAYRAIQFNALRELPFNPGEVE
jgi:hypothetical protein